MLAYAHILEMTRQGNQNHYRVLNEDLLDYIAQRERNTYNFLYIYLEKILSDSGFWRHFLAYKENPTAAAFNV
jgi:hypothetical protein